MFPKTKTYRSVSETKRLIGIFIFVSFFVVLIAYGFMQTKDILSGPQISIVSPRSGEVLSSSLTIIKGITSHITELSLNGRTIFTDEFGKFEERLLLASGYSILKVTARDRFGRERVEELPVFVK
ncbi:MAG: hypothetical protein AAB682_02480 [Patescibacteria group bacterium]